LYCTNPTAAYKLKQEIQFTPDNLLFFIMVDAWVVMESSLIDGGQNCLGVRRVWIEVVLRLAVGAWLVSELGLVLRFAKPK